MKVHFEVRKIGNIDDYIDMPIKKDNKIVGVIRTIIELENTYLLTAYIWDKYISYDFEVSKDRIYSMEILEQQI